jgi:carotenoid cleavage dioxygenase-like enzyme
VIGFGEELLLPVEGTLPPDLQGTLVRVGPGAPEGSGGGADRAGEGALHAVELRDGQAVSYRSHQSAGDAGVFWHAGSLLVLPESGFPSQYSRTLEPEEFTGRLTVPVASHVHRLAADGVRVLFSVDDGTHDAATDGGAVDADTSDAEGVWLRIGEWDSSGALRAAQSVALERATWQHDVAVTTSHVVFIESPTTRGAGARDAAVPFGWVPGAEGWMGIVPRDGDGTTVRWFRLDPCLVTHLLGAYEEATPPSGVRTGDGGDGGDIVLYVCRYDVPEKGQPVDLSASVVGPLGIGLSPIGASLAVLERWRVTGASLERVQLDDRHVEYPRMDAVHEGTAFRYGYCVEMAWDRIRLAGVPEGLLQFDLLRDELRTWSPGPGRRPSEPIFVRAADGRSDDEGWVLTVVDDPDRAASDLYVLDASAFGRRRPEAIVHLPERLPFRSHGEWVPADSYR